jgi:hypothetical protein
LTKKLNYVSMSGNDFGDKEWAEQKEARYL